MAECRSVYGPEEQTVEESWDWTIQMFENSEQTRENVRQLANELGQNGKYCNPVQIDALEKHVSNGTHRLVAAFQTRPDKKMFFATKEKPTPEADWHYTLVGYFECDSDELYDHIFEETRSFSVSYGWVEVHPSVSRASITFWIDFTNHTNVPDEETGWTHEARQKIFELTGIETELAIEFYD